MLWNLQYYIAAARCSASSAGLLSVSDKLPRMKIQHLAMEAEVHDYFLWEMPSEAYEGFAAEMPCAMGDLVMIFSLRLIYMIDSCCEARAWA